MKLLAIVTVACLLATSAGSQTPVRDQQRVATAGTARITGIVVADDETRKPLRQATANLTRANVEDIRAVATDDEGRFSFDQLPAGSYTLSASKGAYISMSYGAPKPGMPGGGPITLTEGQSFVAQPMALMRGAVIAGRLLDRTGRPVASAQVQAFQILTLNGERRRRSASGASGSAMTNAHGDYRIFGLLPGEYLISSTAVPSPMQSEATAAELAWATRPDGVAPALGRAFIYAPTMFPGTSDPAAGVVISLGRSEERLGTDFSLQTVPVSRVSGKVTGPDGRPPQTSLVFCSLKEPNQLLAPSGLPISQPGPDGAFACQGLAPGQYAIGARVLLPTSPIAMWGFTDVTVSGRDLSDVAVQVRPGVTVSGRVTLRVSGVSPQPDLSRAQVRLLPVNTTLPISITTAATIGADGAFQIDGVVPAAYRLTATIGIAASSNWFMQSALLGGNDIADVPVDITQNMSGLAVTLSDMPGELAGTLSGSDARPAPQLYVFVFPTDKNLWLNGARRIRYVRTSESGSYVMPGLPPGEYYLCALAEFETALQFEPGYLEQLVPSAIKITLGEGEKRQDLKIGR